MPANKITRSFTIDRHKYRVSTRLYDDYLSLNGPGIVGGLTMPAGTTIADADLRDKVIVAVRDYRERSKQARAEFQEYLAQQRKEGAL